HHKQFNLSIISPDRGFCSPLYRPLVTMEYLKPATVFPEWGTSGLLAARVKKSYSLSILDIRGDKVGTSRAIGALLCVVCVVIAALYVYFPFVIGYGTAPLWLVLPVVIGVFILAGLGFWLGWIMFSTKEISPVPAPAPSVVEGEPESERESEPKKKEE
ncbi:MAG: hypothetical protein QMD10_11280, partial [Desulfitobacteriaceae bacterium]|nr:hypothetical protein [Desulfitobacteriaceae bacterium]